MNRKVINTLILAGVFVLIVVIGSFYVYYNLGGKLEEKEKKLKELKQNEYDTEALQKQLDDLMRRANVLDSILALRKFNIPANLRQSRFYDFVNKVSRGFNQLSFVNIKYEDVAYKTNFNFYTYKLNGTATFNDIYRLIYAIEQSKELKKISDLKMKNFVTVDDDGIPHYLVNYQMDVQVYFANNDRFASKELRENRLIPNRIYDTFYPLIRNQIPPNIDNLLDVQTAELLALVPDGAFMTDASGNTFMLWEGDPVYLGYLTKIDYKKNEVKFILNKGGIIEKVTLSLDKNEKMSFNTTERSKNEKNSKSNSNIISY